MVNDNSAIARFSMIGLYNVDPETAELDVLQIFQRMTELFRLVWQSLSVGLGLIRPIFNFLQTPKQRRARECRRFVHAAMRSIIAKSRETGGTSSRDCGTVYTQLGESAHISPPLFWLTTKHSLDTAPTCADEKEMVRQCAFLMAAAIDTTGECRQKGIMFRP